LKESEKHAVDRDGPEAAKLRASNASKAQRAMGAYFAKTEHSNTSMDGIIGNTSGLKASIAHPPG